MNNREPDFSCEMVFAALKGFPRGRQGFYRVGGDNLTVTPAVYFCPIPGKKYDVAIYLTGHGYAVARPQESVMLLPAEMNDLSGQIFATLAFRKHGRGMSGEHPETGHRVVLGRVWEKMAPLPEAGKLIRVQLLPIFGLWIALPAAAKQDEVVESLGTELVHLDNTPERLLYVRCGESYQHVSLILNDPHWRAWTSERVKKLAKAERIKFSVDDRHGKIREMEKDGQDASKLKRLVEHYQQVLQAIGEAEANALRWLELRNTPTLKPPTGGGSTGVSKRADQGGATRQAAPKKTRVRKTEGAEPRKNPSGKAVMSGDGEVTVNGTGPLTTSLASALAQAGVVPSQDAGAQTA